MIGPGRRLFPGSLRPRGRRGAGAWAGLLLAVTAASLLAGCGSPQAPDLILADARVFTADTARPWAGAVAVREGRIAAVGATEEIRRLAGRETRTLDLDGRPVVPGLVDAHEHVVWPEPDGVRLELSAQGPMPDPSWSEVRAAIESAAKEAPQGAWIQGTVGPSVLSDPRADRAALDAVAAGRPVKLEGATGHGLLLNSAALQRLGLDEEAEDPPGGWFGRVAGARTLNGWLWEYAQFAAERRLLEDVPTSAGVEAVRAFADAALGWGITSVHETGSPLRLEAHLEILERAAPEIRWTVYRFPMSPGDVGDAAGDSLPVTAPANIRVAGVKWILDGTPVDGNVLSRRPVPDGGHGRMNFSADEVRTLLANALERDEQPALHVAGDSTLALVLGTMEGLADAPAWQKLRVRIEHGDGLGGDLVGRASRLGLVLVQNPLHFQAIAALAKTGGEDRVARPPQALRSAREAGIRVALGSDAGGSARNPWLNLMLAVTHPARPEEALSREEALRAYTLGGAYAEGTEDRKGRLVPGAAADLAVLSQDVFEVPVERLPQTRSLLTLVDGEVVHVDDELAGAL